MRLTLLELTQTILSSLGSDEVNSISDTTESLQVADIIKQTYMNMIGRYDLPSQNQLFQLTPSGDPTSPVLMSFPEGVTRVEWIKYLDTSPADSLQVDQYGAYSPHDTNTDLQNNSNDTTTTGPVYKEIKILPIQDFIELVNSMNPNQSNVDTFMFKDPSNSTGLPQTFQFYYTNDLQPQYCCILDNKYLIFDSYDNTQDSTLQAAKSMCFGWVYPPFVMLDNVYPPIEDQQVPLLLADAKSLAFNELKRAPHAKAEDEVNKQVTSLMKFKATANKPSYFDEYPNFGRSWSGIYRSRN